MKKIKLNAKDLRASEPDLAEVKKVKRRPIYIICDNILDTYNIGSIFRLADAVGASGVYLCGESETPPNIKISRAAVGTDKWIPWKYFPRAVDAIVELRNKFPNVIASEAKQSDSGQARMTNDNGIASSSASGRTPRNDKVGIKVVAIEQDRRSIDFRKVDYKLPVAFVIGHETTGVKKETLDACDGVVEIPMYGVNVSLNVMVSLAIVLFNAVG